MKSFALRAASTAGAFAAAGVTAKVLKDRESERRRLTRGDEVPFGSVRGDALEVISSDGLSIHTELDEGTGPTIVFVHGWLCDSDTWHYQRLAMRENNARMVVMDQRSHGRSGRSTHRNSGLDLLADDLARVIETVAPEGPLVLVGHSMGGMTIMKLAQQRPDLFAERVKGVVLIGTSAGKLMRSSAMIRYVSGILRFGQPVLDWGRGFNSRSVIRRWGVGPDASDLALELANEMILRVPSSVISNFHANFLDLDLTAGLATIASARTSVVCGTRDSITPFQHSKWIASNIEGSELVPVNGAGHMVMFEEPEQVTEAIERVLKDIE